jgi:hypothetical protein
VWVVRNDAFPRENRRGSGTFLTLVTRSRGNAEGEQLFSASPRPRVNRPLLNQARTRTKTAEDIDPDEVFRDVTSRDPGRDFHF